jgi:RNA polymerase sigma factor (sigma-70 family)
VVQISANEPNKNPFVELLNRASRGDREAQTIICQRYEKQVRIVARILLGPQLRAHLDSIDLMQSVHHSLLMGLKENRFDISSPEKLVALACTIARRKVARKWRMHRRQISRGFVTGDSISIAETLSLVTNPHSDPSAVAEYNEELVQVCERLKEIERRMLEMRLDGYTSGEISEALQINPVAIRVRWTRLRQKLDAAGIFADWMD